MIVFYIKLIQSIFITLQQAFPTKVVGMNSSLDHYWQSIVLTLNANTGLTLNAKCLTPAAEIYTTRKFSKRP
jgi:type IV secretory pathway TrbL component